MGDATAVPADQLAGLHPLQIGPVAIPLGAFPRLPFQRGHAAAFLGCRLRRGLLVGDKLKVVLREEGLDVTERAILG
jgi:hypothetical protein